MNKILLTSAILVNLSACVSFNPGKIDFVPGMQDVPVLEGFTLESEKSSIFDTSSGKIVEATAIGISTVKEVEEFYTDTLPHLGWAEAENLVFLKEGEELKITAERAKKITTVHYYLSPSENISMPANIGSKEKKLNQL